MIHPRCSAAGLLSGAVEQQEHASEQAGGEEQAHEPTKVQFATDLIFEIARAWSDDNGSLSGAELPSGAFFIVM